MNCSDVMDAKITTTAKNGKCIIAVPGKVPDKNKLPTNDDIYEAILGAKPSLALNAKTVKVSVPMG